MHSLSACFLSILCIFFSISTHLSLSFPFLPYPSLLLDSLLLSLTHSSPSFFSSFSPSLFLSSHPPSLSHSLSPLPWLSLQPILSISLPPSRLPLILHLYLLFSVSPLFPSLPSSFSLFPPPLLSLILTSVTLHQAERFVPKETHFQLPVSAHSKPVAPTAKMTENKNSDGEHV